MGITFLHGIHERHCAESQVVILSFHYIQRRCFHRKRDTINYLKIKKRLEVRLVKENLSQTKMNPRWIPTNEESESVTEASKQILVDRLATSSVGMPVYNKFKAVSANLPSMTWSGSVYSEWAGIMNIAGDYIPGTRFGNDKDWAGPSSTAHGYVTSNIVSKNIGDVVDYSLSFRVEVKGGGKKRGNGSWRDKCSTVTFDATGTSTIPGCDNLLECSPFVSLQITGLDSIPGSSAEFFLNDSPIKEGQSYLIDRTEADNVVKSQIKGSRSHCGKYGAPDETFRLNIRLTQETKSIPVTPLDITKLNVADDYFLVSAWMKDFDKGLSDSLSKESTGEFIFRYVHYFEEAQQESALELSRLSSIRVMNTHVIQEANARYVPIVNRLINEKKKMIMRLPLEEVNDLLDEVVQHDRSLLKSAQVNTKLEKLLARVDSKLLEEIKLDAKNLNMNFEKKYLLVAFYKKISDLLVRLSHDLDRDIRRLELEKTQIKHLIKEDERLGVFNEVP